MPCGTAVANDLICASRFLPELPDSLGPDAERSATSAVNATIAVPNTVANKFNATWHDERSREATIRVALRVNQN